MSRTFSPRRLAQARAAAGLRREAVAVAIDRSAASVTAYEHGQADPPASVVGRLADTLGVVVDDLYEADR